MNRLRTRLPWIALAASALFGCGGSGDSTPPTSNDPDVSSDDIVMLGDLAEADTDKASAGEMIGEPATLLAEGKREALKVNHDVGAVLDFLHLAHAGAPDAKGVGPLGFKWARWQSTVGGADVRLFVAHTAPSRVRYVVKASKTGANNFIPLLTGIFLKKGPGVGGGRFHVSLSNVSDVYGSPNVDGTMHFWFANHKADVRGRRVAYVDVKDRTDPSAHVASFGADLIRFPGVGGRFRTVAIGDIAPKLPGTEIFAARIQWKHGEGGRGAAALATLQDAKTSKLVHKAQECWDKSGLRTAYASTPTDPNNATEGDLTTCAGLAKDDEPVAAVTPGTDDHDADLDAALADSGASDIAEADAQDASDPSAP